MREQYIKLHKDRRDKPSEIPAWFRKMYNRKFRAKIHQKMRECSDWDNEVMPKKARSIRWLWL